MIVVKIGGGGGVDLDACCEDLAGLYREEPVVLVHGGSQPATLLGEALGHTPAFITTPSGMRSRYTDARTLEIFTMALAGLNTRIVACLQQRGIDALGLSGVDGRILQARRKSTVTAVEPDGRRRVIRDDHSGAVEQVNTPLLSTLIVSGYLPVISPPAYTPDGPVNVDGDRSAALIAAAVGARALVLLTNVPGLLRSLDDPTSLVERVTGDDEIDAALDLAAGRMRIKLLAAREALRAGVPRVTIADGRGDRPITRALRGEGTVVVMPPGAHAAGAGAPGAAAGAPDRS